jgi:hypothetical protein
LFARLPKGCFKKSLLRDHESQVEARRGQQNVSWTLMGRFHLMILAEKSCGVIDGRVSLNDFGEKKLWCTPEIL